MLSIYTYMYMWTHLVLNAPFGTYKPFLLSISNQRNHRGCIASESFCWVGINMYSNNSEEKKNTLLLLSNVGHSTIISD